MRYSAHFTFFCLLCLLGTVNAQQSRTISELLEVLSQNHMGAVTDVLSLEEIKIIKKYYQSPFNVSLPQLEQIKISTTQSVGMVTAADIDPGNLVDVNVLANSPANTFEGAGIVLRNAPPESRKAYIIAHGSNILFHRNLFSGEYTEIGSISGIPAGMSISGMSQIGNSSVIYGIATNGAGDSVLLQIDIDLLSATVNGADNNIEVPIALSEDGMGNLVTIDIDTDNAFRIDKGTGTITLLGGIGYNANFGQGLLYESSTNRILSVAYDMTVGDSVLYEMDANTGALTAQGIIQPGLIQQFGWGDAYDRDALNIQDFTTATFIMYPNPAHDLVNIQGNITIDTIDVFSMMGQLLKSENIKLMSHQLDVSALSAGNYIVRISSANHSENFKLSKL